MGRCDCILTNALEIPRIQTFCIKGSGSACISDSGALVTASQSDGTPIFVGPLSHGSGKNLADPSATCDVGSSNGCTMVSHYKDEIYAHTGVACTPWIHWVLWIFN